MQKYAPKVKLYKGTNFLSFKFVRPAEGKAGKREHCLPATSAGSRRGRGHTQRLGLERLLLSPAERYQRQRAGNAPDQLKKSRKPKYLSTCGHRVNVQPRRPARFLQACKDRLVTSQGELPTPRRLTEPLYFSRETSLPLMFTTLKV